MASMRVHELAKEFDMSSKELLDKLQQMKIPAKSHASMLADAYVDKIRKNLEPEIKQRAGQLEDEEARKLAGKAELMRIVRDPSGAVSFDKTGRAPGRGAYVCSEECFAAACKKKKLDRALKATLGSDEYDRIAADVALAAREARQK